MKIRLRFDHCIANGDGDEVAKIWVLWQSSLQLNHVLSHRQFLVLSMGAVGEPDAFFIFVYAKCTVVDRRVLWHELHSFVCSNCKQTYDLGG